MMWMQLLQFTSSDVMSACVQVMIRHPPDWKPAASREEAPKLELGDLVEAVDVPEEQEDTVFWRGCIHELKPDGQVCVRYNSCVRETNPVQQFSMFHLQCRCTGVIIV
jgi:hypothetical protein